MKPPQLMGILNVTPDSFSDGGAFASAEAAVAQFAQLVADGADIVDIGAESTRPGATPLNQAEEWVRLEPVLARIIKHSARAAVKISIDTRHAETARRTLALGVEIINDVGGLRDAAMREILAEADCAIVVMHALSIPVDKSVTLPRECDPVQGILRWKNEVISVAEKAKISLDRLIFDPGIGFGKSPGQSLALILRARELIVSGNYWLYGHSRKSFLNLFSDAPPSERDALTLAFSAQLAAQNVAYLRVHAVREHRELLEKI